MALLAPGLPLEPACRRGILSTTCGQWHTAITPRDTPLWSSSRVAPILWIRCFVADAVNANSIILCGTWPNHIAPHNNTNYQTNWPSNQKPEEGNNFNLVLLYIQHNGLHFTKVLDDTIAVIQEIASDNFEVHVNDVLQYLLTRGEIVQIDLIQNDEITQAFLERLRNN